MGTPFVVRLADRLMGDVHTLAPQRAMDRLTDAAEAGPRFILDDLVQYLSQMEDQEYILEKDFPSSIPPYDVCFMEGLSPPERHEMKGQVFTAAVVRRLPSLSEDFTWLIAYEVFLGQRYEQRTMVHPVTTLFLGHDEQGNPIPSFNSLKIHDERINEEQAAAFCLPFIYANSLANCKNVTVDDVERPHKGIERSMKQKLGRLLLSYRTLNIKGFKAAAGSSPTTESINGAVRMHLCRGHFKNLKHERFKTPGLHWWPQHIRGNPEAGVVVKDYKVSAPTKA